MKPLFRAIVDYEDPYVQPVIQQAIESQLPSDSYELVLTHTKGEQDDGHNTESAASLIRTNRDSQLLQWCSYETIDFQLALSSKSEHKALINAYIIRKALIRKHYLSNTIFSWVTKNPTSILKQHFKPCVEFELDYAEFLDEALLEAYELREAFERNETKSPEDREWWILKPGMSDRAGGIRLFSTEDELTAIFEGWEADAPGSDDEEDNDDADDRPEETDKPHDNPQSETIITSHLRHFIAQPYIHNPLLIADPPFDNRKFHIRTYVVAYGALKVYVYDRMLALFASEPYAPPWNLNSYDESRENSTSDFEIPSQAQKNETLMLHKLRNIHLTNTCIQHLNTLHRTDPLIDHSATSTPAEQTQTQTRNEIQRNIEHVYLLSDLPLASSLLKSITAQINSVTAELFRAALAHPTNFQPLPVSFEIFGLDFLLEDSASASASASASSRGSTEDTGTDNIESGGDVTVQLLEVNAFPDFAQTGERLKSVVVRRLFEEVVEKIVKTHFNIGFGVGEPEFEDKDEVSAEADGLNDTKGGGRLVKVLDVDLGLR